MERGSNWLLNLAGPAHSLDIDGFLHEHIWLQEHGLLMPFLVDHAGADDDACWQARRADCSND
jgi:hypothetical protein